ncbi:MAG: TRAP transporter substrate-binding protein [Burkholderiales bacterium]|nr:TRAP transporter substrate-binding protein [Burkholderiales bacterium]
MKRVIGLGVLLGLCSAAASGATTLRAADTHPAGYPTVQAVLYMGERLEARSGGRYRIRVFAERQLGEEKETIAQTRSGAIDLNRVNLAPFNDVVPETVIPSLPFLFRSTEHMRRALDGPVGAEILAAFERHGLVGLAFYDSGARSFYTRDRPVRAADDFRGLKLRVQQSQLFVDLVAALGARGVGLPYGQVMTALETGLVDGAENNWPSYESSGHFRVAPHYTLTEHSMAPEVLVMSMARWQRLAPADRALVRRCATESVRRMRELWSERERQSEARVRAAGVVVIRPAPEAMRELAERVRPMYERHVRDPRLKAMLERIRAMAP